MAVHTNKWWPLSASSEKLRKKVVNWMCKWFKAFLWFSLELLGNKIKIKKKYCAFFFLLVGSFGARTRYVTMMPRLRQALVEFENIEDAIVCVQTSQVPVS